MGRERRYPKRADKSDRRAGSACGATETRSEAAAMATDAREYALADLDAASEAADCERSSSSCFSDLSSCERMTDSCSSDFLSCERMSSSCTSDFASCSRRASSCAPEFSSCERETSSCSQAGSSSHDGMPSTAAASAAFIASEGVGPSNEKPSKAEAKSSSLTDTHRVPSSLMFFLSICLTSVAVVALTFGGMVLLKNGLRPAGLAVSACAVGAASFELAAAILNARAAR